jgi:hypothetical protein
LYSEGEHVLAARGDRCTCVGIYLTATKVPAATTISAAGAAAARAATLAADEAEGLVGDEGSDERADERSAAATSADRAQAPERDLDQDVQQSDGDQ